MSLNLKGHCLAEMPLNIQLYGIKKCYKAKQKPQFLDRAKDCKDGGENKLLYNK